jgi:membrane dipeptidase
MDCNLEKMIDHMDHICQLAGNTNHVGIGTDLDGAFGNEQCPHDLETIAELTKMPALLMQRGYTKNDCQEIMHGNWLRVLRQTWK